MKWTVIGGLSGVCSAFDGWVHLHHSLLPLVSESLSSFVFSGSFNMYQTISVQFSHSVLSDSLWPHGLQHARFPVLHYFAEFAQTHVHWFGDAIQPSHSLSPLSPPALNLFQYLQVIYSSNEWALCISWLKYWGFSFGISPSNEYSGWFP